MVERIKLTKTKIGELEATGKDRLVYDTEVPRLFVRVKPSGKKSFALQYRCKTSRKEKRSTFGDAEMLSVPAARQWAQQLLGEVAKGKDPVGQSAKNHASPTIKEFAERFLLEHVTQKKKASSAKEDRRYLKQKIIPKLGSTKLQSVSRAQVAELHQSMKQTPYAANRMLATLSKLMSYASECGAFEGENPCKHVSKFKEQSKQRFLSSDEIDRVVEALEKHHSEAPQIVDAIRLLILTGARKNEILNLRWADVDLEKREVSLAVSKTGPRTIHLAEPTVDFIETISRDAGSDYLFHGEDRGKPLVDIYKRWQKIRDEAKIPDVRLHDLRHTYASLAVGQGMSLPQIGALLGHKNPQTTQKYAHLDASPAKEAAAQVASVLPTF